MSQNKKKKKWILPLIVTLLIVTATAVMIGILASGSQSRNTLPVYSNLTVEAGAPFQAQDFVKSAGVTATVDENSFYDLSAVGDYPLLLHLSTGSDVNVTLKVRDTTPPAVGELTPVLLKKGSAPKASDLIAPGEYTDSTDVRVQYLTPADTAKEGAGTAVLRLEDGGGNVTRADVPYYVTEALNVDYYYEIGSALPDEDDLLPGCGARFYEGRVPMAKAPGMISVIMEVFGGRYRARYEARDTIAPTAVPRENVSVQVGEELPDPIRFFESVTDATEVTAAYEEEYRFDEARQMTLRISLTDLGGNRGIWEIPVQVYEAGEGADTVAPVISGVKDLHTVLGAQPDYLDGVSAYDGRDGVIPPEKISVDVSSVDLSQPSFGRGYPVVYSVRDAAGNLAKVTAFVVVERGDVTEEEKNACFGEVLSHVPTEGRSRFTVLSEVYEYLTGACAISDGEAHAAKNDYETEAYWGFRLKTGDENTILAMTRVVLDRLGIEYIVVNRQKTGSVAHAWLLVDYGVGWLYMDTAPIDGYVWTKDGHVYKDTSDAAKELSPVELRKREAMTDQDLEELTNLLNAQAPGWNYYRIDLSANLPRAAQRTADGSYYSPEYTVRYEALSGGSVTGKTEQTVTHGSYAETVRAVPKTGYRFVTWDDGYTEAVRRDCVKKDLTVRALFEPDSGTITTHEVRYIAGEHGRIVGADVQKLLYGKVTTAVTAVPDDGYYFVSWSDGKTSATRSDTVRGSADYTAVFARMVVLQYRAADGGSVEGNALQTVLPGSAGSFVKAVAQKGYLFTGWSDGVTTEQRRDTVSEDFTVTAQFEKDTASYTVVYRAGKGGTLTGVTEQTALSGETGSPVTAKADEGYVFVSWSDGLAKATRSDVIYRNETITAIFREKQTYTLRYTAAQGGRISGEALQTLIEGQQGGAVTAVAEEGYRFVAWSDGNTDPVRQDLPTADLTLQALFEEVQTPGENEV